jgi:hypothetical protein
LLSEQGTFCIFSVMSFRPELAAIIALIMLGCAAKEETTQTADWQRQAKYQDRFRLLSARNGSFSKQCPSFGGARSKLRESLDREGAPAPGVVNSAYTPRLLLFSDFKTDCPRQPTWESAAGPVIEIPERLSQSPAHRVAGPQGRANSSTRTAEAAFHEFG